MATGILKELNNKFDFYYNYFKELIVLSIPIMMGNVGNLLIGAGAVIIAGRHSTTTLAAISVATAISMTFIIAGIGFLSSITPVIANLRGEKKPTRNLLRVTLKYSMIISLITFSLIWLVIFLVPYIHLADNLTELVVEYLQITSFSIFGVFIFVAIKEFLQAFEIVIFPNVVSIVSIFVNVILCVILVFGFGIIPPLGAKGLAIAILIVRTLEGMVLLFYCIPFLRTGARLTNHYIKDLVKTGWPISLALFAEFLGFNITAVLVGKFSALYAAAHNVIITMTSISYMVPLSISNAMAIKVGYSNGERSIDDIKRYTLCGTAIIVGFMLLMVWVYSSFPSLLMQIFTNDMSVVSAGVPVIFVVVCFLLFDGIQCSASGALKGLKQTKPIMLTMIFSYLVFCIPIGCILAYKFNIVLLGFWIGLAVALFIASIISTTFLVINIKRIAREFKLSAHTR